MLESARLLKAIQDTEDTARKLSPERLVGMMQVASIYEVARQLALIREEGFRQDTKEPKP